MSLQVDFVGSFPRVTKCPDFKKPEYAFIGRSNVGKSSFINALLERRQIAKVSATPGKTQLINLFKVEDQWLIADLPGYGYAKVSKKARASWQKMINQYLLHRKSLMLTFVLIDLRLPPQEIDLNFLYWLGENEIPFAIVFTKADKVKKLKAESNREAFESTILESWTELPPCFVTSSKTGEGREDVLSYIARTNELWTKR